MSEPYKPARFFGYPQARKGPDVPYGVERKPNPVLRGPFLAVAAYLMESIRFIREHAWQNAGFACLRDIRDFIADYEPRYEPTVTPLPLSPEDAGSQGQKAQLSALIEANRESRPRQFYSVADYRALYLSGEVTPTDVVNAIIPLIRRDASEPGKSGKHATAWLEIKLDLILKAAEASTLRYKSKQSLGALDGVPTAVKDEYDLDGYSTTLGSLTDYSGQALEGESITSWLPRKLEEAGAVIIGKLSMHEFGLDTTGNNPHYGTPLNPFNPNYYTGGSSSGPGYAVGTGIIPIALGSDGGGSIRIPSSCCSIFGLKPTHNRLSGWPGANHSPTCGVNGPMAVDMQSLAVMYEAIAEPHSSTQFPPLALQPAPPMAKVLGIYDAWFSRSKPGVQTLVRRLLDTLTSQHGYHIVPIEIPFVAEAQTAHALTVLTDGATLLDDTNGITAANKILLALGRTALSTDYLLAQKLRGMLMQHLAHLWKLYPGMLIITPTMACAGWPIRSGKSELKYGFSDGTYTLESMEYVWLANFCGLPAITVPAGYVTPEGSKNAGQVADKDTEGMVPIGLMAAGEWCSENALLQFGFDAELAGQDKRCKPPIWEDVISKAKTQARTDATLGNGVAEH
ncbi:Fc.00g044950.m01.CDS01 [Cosmosporella sp. VM-42]